MLNIIFNRILDLMEYSNDSEDLWITIVETEETIENDDPNTQISNTQRKQPEELLLQVHKQNVVHDEHFVKLIEINTLLNKNLVKLIEAISRLTEEQSSTNENLVKLIEAISRLTEEQCLTNQHLKVLLQKQANDDGGEQKFTNSSSAMENKLG
ncbi:hypothetical protein I4U23_029357 [Adineta vaga]|nr:hypothetical protein I4U23_029357 [Adineta vaga]